MGDIDHSYTDEVVCPHCGYKYDCSHELFGETNNETDIRCDDCGGFFDAERDFTVYYSTTINAAIAREKEGDNGN